MSFDYSLNYLHLIIPLFFVLDDPSPSPGAPSGHANANPEDHDGEVKDNGKAKS